MDKVTVCITTYNLAPFISQCIDSVLNQKTDFDFKILIGDDFSTDGTREILKHYESKFPNKIKIFLHSKNRGVNFNDFNLIKECNSVYIAWLDGDDYWIDNKKLQKQVNFLDGNSQCSGVYTSWYNLKEDGILEKRIRDVYTWENNSFGRSYVERILLNENSGFRLSSLMFRKKIFDENLQIFKRLYLEVFHQQNDTALFCILAFNGKLGYLEDPTTVYRIRNISLSHFNEIKRRFKYNFGLYQLNYSLIKLYDLERKNIIQSQLSVILPYIFLNNLTEEANLIQNQCKDIGYKLSFGQRLLIKGSSNFILSKIINIIFSKKLSYYRK